MFSPRLTQTGSLSMYEILAYQPCITPTQDARNLCRLSEPRHNVCLLFYKKYIRNNLKTIDGLHLFLNSRSLPLSNLSAYQECKKEDLQKKNRPSSD